MAAQTPEAFASVGTATSSRRSRTRNGLLARIALVTAICIGAYHYSLFTLLRELLQPTPLEYVGLVPLISMLLCAALAPRAGNEPDIHDRYLDWIVGLPLLGAALAVVEIGPVQLSTYFWLWRLDLLSLPLFIAGAVDLAFGARALWRLRLPIAFLVLAWPAPYVVALSPSAGLAVFALVALALVVLLRRRLRAGVSALVSRAAGDRGALALPSRCGVRRAPLALVVLLLAGAMAATASESLRQFELVATPLGQPVLQPSAVTSHPVPGWALTKTDSFAWITTYLGRDADWDRYEYAFASSDAAMPQPGSVSPITLDLFTASSQHALGTYGIEGAYRLLYRYRPVDTSLVDLGGGVVGHSAVYASRSSTAVWTAVYWDWPVETAHGLAYERVVLHVTNQVGDTATDFLVAFGHEVVAASAGRAGADSLPLDPIPTLFLIRGRAA